MSSIEILELVVRKLTQEEAHAKWVAVHGDEYDYTNTVYVKSNQYIYVRCKKHDYVFPVTHNNHIKGKGCHICSGNKKSNTEEFIDKARKLHGDFYDYSLVVYINAKEKVDIICPEHGVFQQTPNDHLSNKGCGRCVAPVTNTKEFIEAAVKVHGDRYNYSKVQYVNAKTEVVIICKVHGEFTQTPNNHLQRNNCDKCGNLARGDALRMSYEEFVESSVKVHGDKYNYDRVIYHNNTTEVEIFCNKHKTYFWQQPTQHIHKESGCHNCATYGFKRTEPAVIYVLDCEKFIGFGITNDFDTRIRTHRRNLLNAGLSMDVLNTFDVIGELALSVESGFKRKYKDILINAGVEGFITEAISRINLEVLLNHIKENLPEGRFIEA